MQDIASTVFDFIVFTVIFKVIIVRWFADQLMKVFKKVFVRSKREIAIWNHYYNRASGNGHKKKHPSECTEEGCSLV